MDTDWRATVRAWPEWKRIEWSERAAIREYDGGLSRAEAERAAYEYVVRMCGDA